MKKEIKRRIHRGIKHTHAVCGISAAVEREQDKSTGRDAQSSHTVAVRRVKEL